VNDARFISQTKTWFHSWPTSIVQLSDGNAQPLRERMLAEGYFKVDPSLGFFQV